MSNVLIEKVPSSSIYQDSQLIVRLDKSEEYVAKALKGGKLIAMHFKSLSLDSLPASASVRVSRHLKCKSDANFNDHNACTASKRIDCDRYRDGICSFSEISCNLCGTKITMTSAANKFSDCFSWELSDADSNRIIMSSDSTLSPHTTYSESICLAFGDCNFASRCLKNQTTAENVSYSSKTADLTFHEKSTKECFDSEEFFLPAHLMLITLTITGALQMFAILRQEFAKTK